MSVECKGDNVTIISEVGNKEGLPDVFIWTIGEDSVVMHIDKALEKIFPEQYLRFNKNEDIVLTIK